MMAVAVILNVVTRFALLPYAQSRTAPSSVIPSWFSEPFRWSLQTTDRILPPTPGAAAAATATEHREVQRCFFEISKEYIQRGDYIASYYWIPFLRSYFQRYTLLDLLSLRSRCALRVRRHGGDVFTA